MNPIWRALLTSWDWRADVILTLSLAGLLYTRGWLEMRSRGRRRLANGWRLASYWLGLLLLGLALLSAIDIFGEMLLLMHMVQHLILVMIAPPLLLLANPFPFALWGLPPVLRRGVVRLFSRRASFRRNLRAVTARGLVWFMFIAVFLGWHDPNAYNAALRNDLVHDLEHLTFFGTALLFWWHVSAAGPRLHGRFAPAFRIAYLLMALPINAMLGIALTFSRQPLYTYYTTVPRLWGISVMQDQMLGGQIMWVPGSMMYVIAAAILLGRSLHADRSESSPPRTEARDNYASGHVRARVGEARL